MARAQGLLTGPSLSEVQVTALHLLEVANMRERGKASSDAIKNAMVSANPSLLRILYPELASKKSGRVREKSSEPPASVEPPSPDQVDEMDRWIQQASSASGASMSGADLYGPEDGWE